VLDDSTMGCGASSGAVQDEQSEKGSFFQVPARRIPSSMRPKVCLIAATGDVVSCCDLSCFLRGLGSSVG
jgi:hypothetical protein